MNREWNWKSKDGLVMYAQSWETEGVPEAIICLVHGLGEHSGRYVHVAKAFTDAGFATVALDLRGHGKSGGQRGHFPSLETIMDDIHGLIQQAREKFPESPAFLYGHSLGGLLVLNYATYHKHALSGVIVTGAGLRSPVLEQKAKVMLSKALGGLLPTATIPTGLNADDISRDLDVVRAYKEDPLVHDVVTLAGARTGMLAVERAFTHAGEFNTPLLIMHGAADKLTYPRGSQEFADLVPAGSLLKFWNGLYHEVHNEPEQSEVFAFVSDWIHSQLRNK